MKKIIITAAIILTIALIITALLPVVCASELKSSEFYLIDGTEGTYAIRHIIGNDIVDGSFSGSKKTLSEEYYLYDLLLNESSEHYDINAFTLTVDFGTNKGNSVSSAFAKGGTGDYKSLNANGGILEFRAEGGYMHLTMLVHREYGDGEIPVMLQYSVDGNGWLNSHSHFGGFEYEIII